MAYLIGTDEAGYGPNLGPLVISASAWEVPDGLDAAAMYDRLAALVSREPRDCVPGGPCLAVADSKALYSPQRGLRLLERAVLASLAVVGRSAGHWHNLVASLAFDEDSRTDAAAWYPDHAPAVPRETACGEAAALGAALREGLASAGVGLVDLRSVLVFPARFNRMLDEHGSKGEALSHQTLALAARLIDRLPGGPITVVCDKHGGRGHYRDLLADHFPDWFIEVRGEGRARSVYRFGPDTRRIEFRFEAGGESCLATALASMTSKYLRELAMEAFNKFWAAQVPSLRPTAGYPEDARRFRKAIAARQAELGIEEGTIWRVK